MEKIKKSTKKERTESALLALLIMAMATLALLIATGTVDSVKLFGICGFEQRHNMPCPFCGMTRSVSKFVTGDIIGSFKMQPAAVLMCTAITIIWVYSVVKALGFSVAAADNIKAKIKPAIAIAVIIAIILLGWAVSIYNYDNIPTP